MQTESHDDDDRPFSIRLFELTESRFVRLFLAALVIISLLPLGPIEITLRPLFVLAFGVELYARGAMWWRGHRDTSRLAIGFAVADAVAFISFLPLEGLVSEEYLHWLALLRLTRLLMLVRFAKDLARDIYAILTRREQLQTLGLISGAVLVLSFVSAVILSQLAIDIDPHTRSMDFSDRLWWSFRQIESADNLVTTLKVNPIVALLSLLLTVTGVFLISFIIGVGANVVEQVVRAERRRPLHYRGHTLVVGAVHESEELIREFVLIYAKNRQVPGPERLLTWLRYMRTTSRRSFPRVALMSREDEPPAFLVEPLMRWVVYRQGDEGDPDDLARINAADAKRAILLADRTQGHEADAVSVSALAALRSINPDCHIYVEVDDPETKDIVLQVGGPHTVALDVPRFLGMFLCQHLLLPGVEDLYRDLLTSDGAEIYTHIFVDPKDVDRLSARGPAFRFEDLLQLAAAHHVVLIGVYLGAETVGRNPRGVVPMENLVLWVNPAADVELPELKALGAARGLVPAGALRGLIGVAEGYLPLRAFAAAVAAGVPPGVTVAEKPSVVAATSTALALPPSGPKRVALVGYSEALPSLLRELSRFVANVEVALFLSERGDEKLPLPRRLESLRVGFDAADALPGRLGQCFPLEKGGQLTIYTHDAPDLSTFAASILSGLDAVEAAVFLSEPSGGDRDARTALRVLRFVRLLEENAVPKGACLHLLAEFVSVDKGLYIQRHLEPRKCGFADERDLRLTLIAKETIKSYFMVHSAFVPGVSDLYSRLLEEAGQDIVRFPWVASASAPASVTWRSLCQALLPRQAIPIALWTTRGTVLAPPPDKPFPAEEIRGVYAIAESGHFPAAAAVDS
ncbi:MAG: hypothetical protein Q8O67_15440 [Deltaproteobacteria bacterium]|nr:hypothetical protein [Deltaproteobacteria bacterium]